MRQIPVKLIIFFVLCGVLSASGKGTCRYLGFCACVCVLAHLTKNQSSRIMIKMAKQEDKGNFTLYLQLWILFQFFPVFIHIGKCLGL